MSAIRRAYYTLLTAGMSVLQHIVARDNKNLKLIISIAILRAQKIRSSGIIVGDDEDLLLGKNVEILCEKNARIVLIKSPFESHKYPPMPPKPYAIGLGLNYEPRFIPFPHARKSTVALQEGATLELQTGAYILPGLFLRAWKNKKIHIGAGTSLGHDVTINTKEGIYIGNYVKIAQGALLMDYDGHPIWYKPDDNPDRYGGRSAPIHIDDHAWIGMRAMIFKGVRIGEGAIVGAGSIVTKDVLPNTIVAGNPAKVVKEGVKWLPY